MQGILLYAVLVNKSKSIEFCVRSRNRRTRIPWRLIDDGKRNVALLRLWSNNAFKKNNFNSRGKSKKRPNRNEGFKSAKRISLLNHKMELP